MSVIYGLLCPETHIVKYVGYDKHDNQKRYKEHCRLSNNHYNTPRCNWLSKLITAGKKPELLVLELNPKDWQQAEKDWIEYYRYYSGKLLTNVADGGLSNGHMQRAENSNKSLGKRSKWSISYANIKNNIRRGYIKNPETLKKFQKVDEMVRNFRKLGTYQKFVQIYEERHANR